MLPQCRYLVCSHCLMSALEGISRCSGITFFPHQCGSKQTHSTVGGSRRLQSAYTQITAEPPTPFARKSLLVTQEVRIALLHLALNPSGFNEKHLN